MSSPSSRSPSPDKPPIRRYRRLVGWDYSKGASFFITISTEPRRSLFGKVENGAMVLSPLGERVLNKRFIAAMGSPSTPSSRFELLELNRQAARIALATPGGMAVHAVPKGGGVAYEDVADSAVTKLSLRNFRSDDHQDVAPLPPLC